MDYEKKYNEILAWAKKYKARLNGVPIEEILPELRESEDERIRKEIISLVKKHAVNHERCQMEAYLEKQKDEAQRQFNLGIQAGREEVMYEMEKEQKPAELSEDDDACYELILKELEHNKESQPDYSRHFSRLIEWFTTRFKSLRPQLKREDWTDEDSLAIKEIQNALEIYMINHGISEKQRKKLARWLDIHCNAYPLPAKLYPHWKPSEEQLNALQAFVGMIHPDACYNAVSSLLDELKAL